VLTRFDTRRPVLLQTDASGDALGAVISHYEVDEKGKRVKEQPVSFASKTLNPHQRNYSVTEKEALAVVWACDLWRSMLLGQRFILETDHSSLKQILSTRDPGGRLCRWFFKLQEFDIDIAHRRGLLHGNADAMSREGVSSVLPDPQTLSMVCLKGKSGKVDVDAIQRAYDEACEEDINSQFRVQSRKDRRRSSGWTAAETGEIGNQVPRDHPKFNMICQWVKKVAPSAMKREDGAWEMEEVQERATNVYERVKVRLVPAVLTNEVIAKVHNSGAAGHQSSKRTLDMVREGHSFPGMASQVEGFVKHCPVCQNYDLPHRSKEVGEYPSPGAPFRVVAFDFLGPLGDRNKGSKAYTHVLVVVDVLSRWVFLSLTRSMKASEVISVFRDKIFPMCGLPTVALLDRESSFMSGKFKTFADDCGLRLHPIPEGSSNSNGMCERAIRTLHSHLKKMVPEKEWSSWTRYLPLCEMIMRNSRRDDINLSPFEILFGFRARGPYSNDLEAPVNALSPLQMWAMSRREFRRIRMEVDEKQRRERRQNTVSNTHPGPKFMVGDLVRRKIKHSRNKEGL
ncbi:unnamed protein product, partial [Heterosigma akashiwo]